MMHDEGRRASPPRPYRPTGDRLIVPVDAVEATLTSLRRFGDQESGLFWYGRREGSLSIVTSVRTPRQRMTPFNYHVSAEAMTQMGASLDEDRSGLPDVLSHAEAEDRYEIVVSAVDKNTSRQDIQGLAPDLVVGASTVGLSAKSNLYRMAPGKACLGCHNAAEKDGDRLRKVEQEVRCMTEVELRKHLDGRAENVDAIVTYLQGGEKCGELGEAQFRNFATATEPDFSVSFVSMAAALLLAARLLSATVFDADAPDRASMATLNFRNLEAGDDRISQDQSCSHCRTADRLSAA